MRLFLSHSLLTASLGLLCSPTRQSAFQKSYRARYCCGDGYSYLLSILCVPVYLRYSVSLSSIPLGVHVGLTQPTRLIHVQSG